MKRALVSVALAALLAAPALAQQPPAEVDAEAKAAVKVEGVAPEKVLGAIDTSKLVDEQPPESAPPESGAPEARTSVTVDTSVRETPTAVVETTTEVIAPVSTRPALDPANPIAPEVQALVDQKPRYTTKDIAEAQLAAVLATPASIPTTTITTTTTTPKPD
jgi:hypothetical protein